MKKAIEITIKGVVQGVGFRKFSKIQADELLIKGSAQNLPDGSVKIYACGEEKDIENFISILKIGPLKSEVQSVELHTIADFSSDVFEIIQ
ncbi:hypothetical protein BKH42_04385 [Helicobacter sp. 13S00482-2]|uniref:acylphosphatase n=1 Tax=Helicobacter sp. 13S00482-2 TaxID=1476200 RepID=UPI000BA4E71D|nr:acylphosphatase [Helicobacter sp. 13S00482-2]PAF53741.1 hypothetical protein BKH42_04385 [Helicobacter sp. 13S00482-2]